MTILDELIEYSNNCLEDKFISEYEDFISCEKHKWACQRFLSDIKRQDTEEFPYVWNEDEAQRIVKWFSYLNHRKGVLAGKPIELTIWQKFVLCQIYGWLNKDTGYRRFNKSFVEVARKNAKSQMESGIALYEISRTAVKNEEVSEGYCAGVKRKQSKIVFDEAIRMLNKSQLKSKFKITRDRITHIKTGSYLEPLNAEDGKKGDGTNPAILIIDEYHQHPTTEFYDLGLGSQTKESLLMIITTAGLDLTFPCYTQEYIYCSKILNPNTDTVNENYFIDILEVDKKDDIELKRNWKKANPIRMFYPEGIKKIADEFKIAIEIPEKMPTFLTKCLNIWVQAKENGYMNMEKWKACEVKTIPYDLKGKDVFVGFDMSAKIDLTSVAFIIPLMDKGIKKYICFSHSFIPNREKLIERTRIDKVPYDAWERNGFLDICDNETIDQQYVLDYVFKICKENNWHISGLCFDPANAGKAISDLNNLGYPVYEIWQSHKQLNEATQGFREQVYNKNVIYTANPLLNFAMSNAVVKKNNGLIKIDKDATTQRIDPVDAMICAFKIAYFHEVVENKFSATDWLKSFNI
ncbi:terminase large subunit [Clostridium perfringens]|uniref:terminase large subunit n=1 Tax=Clostridium perfringens TaxID=1502 RepID=UPI001C85FCA6|nr:terminase TerL endonuclease subunit [Clostridium perfringens]MDK0548558.1 terminase large subunit [Clostridium perfringens]MDK0552350.1 terminase large subunit [Clostridium perfringens]MDK0835180.1 terminase large subunit [Clostridium perfringens]MDK0935515.1 terminase large subunit [Clostridium perfringens]HEE9846998.1 terminase large subunit [Clostridium perfringens]